MRDIYLIRHGMPDFPGGARMCLGRTDLPLGLRGRLQAALLGAEFAGSGLGDCFCSRLTRSRETAELMGCERPVVIPGLEEMDAGEWDGLSFDEIRRRWPEYYERRGRERALPPPGGEEFGPASRRFSAAVARAASLSRGDAVIVSHSSVIQTLLCTLEGVPFSCARDFNLPYGSVTRLRCPEPGRFELVEYGRLPAPVNEDVRKKAIGDQEVITCRPADLLEPEIEKYRQECRQYAKSDEDVLSYALFPQVAEKFFEWRDSQTLGVDNSLLNKDAKVMPV